jgi:hypothetical protein
MLKKFSVTSARILFKGLLPCVVTPGFFFPALSLLPGLIPDHDERYISVEKKVPVRTYFRDVDGGVVFHSLYGLQNIVSSLK